MQLHKNVFRWDEVIFVFGISAVDVSKFVKTYIRFIEYSQSARLQQCIQSHTRQNTNIYICIYTLEWSDDRKCASNMFHN